MKPIVRKVLKSSLAKSLTTPLSVDHYLGLIDSKLSVNEPRGRIADVQRQTPDSVTLTIAPNDNWITPRPGQHILFGIDLDGVRHRRCFSIASAARNDRVEITVKRNGDGVVSNFLVDRAKAGQLVYLSHPEGEFYPNVEPPAKALLLSAGSGITPVMSILRSWIDQDCLPDVVFMHYASTDEDMIYTDELDALADAHASLSLVIRYTQEHGRIDGDTLDREVHELGERMTWLCGPSGFMDAAESLLDARTTKPIFREQFEASRREAAQGEGEVHFIKSDVAASGDEGSLLEVAENAGLNPPYGCRMGICHSCKCRVSEGTVRDLRNNEVREIRDTDIQICIHAAAGDVALEI
ncbi:flavodoxin reductase-like protein [Salinisphaera sp. C84B14]|uniref:ferredoxin reductase n=1 Tax=Salinisphaera sp. C84B14 TaxID=1304155 RepID=UPI00333F9432